MGEGIDGAARELLERPHRFATLATTGADGWPRQAVLWYTLRGDAIVVNSAVGRHWVADLQRDPRFSFMVEDGYEWISVRGRAVPLDDPGAAQRDIAEMARRYLGDSSDRADQAIARFEHQERISFLLHPEIVTVRPI